MSNLQSTIYYLTKKYFITGMLGRLPLVGGWIRSLFELKEIAQACGYRPGHFYSPIPCREDVKERAEEIFSDTGMLDIDLNLDKQFHLLQELAVAHSEFPYDFLGSSEREDLRYRFLDRPQYRYSDVVFLYHVMRHVKPKRVIEIGSGASSAVMLDVNDIFFDSSITFTFIDPYPQRLYGFLNEHDNVTTKVIAEKVQDVSTQVFQELGSNDILFIDSSHVSKIGSDVNHIFFNILPRIGKGVWIHFHDIFYPFEMPLDWVLSKGRFWNESYVLRAFLMNNPSYEVMLFNTLLHKEFQPWFEENMPECLIDKENTGSIWIRKK